MYAHVSFVSSVFSRVSVFNGVKRTDGELNESLSVWFTDSKPFIALTSVRFILPWRLQHDVNVSCDYNVAVFRTALISARSAGDCDSVYELPCFGFSCDISGGRYRPWTRALIPFPSNLRAEPRLGKPFECLSMPQKINAYLKSWVNILKDISSIRIFQADNESVSAVLLHSE